MSKISIEKLIKEKLSNHEFDYDNSWDKFEKKLNNKKANYNYYYFVAAAVVVAILYVSSIYNNDEIIVKTNNNKIVEQIANKSKRTVEKQGNNIIKNEIKEPTITKTNNQTVNINNNTIKNIVSEENNIQDNNQIQPEIVEKTINNTELEKENEQEKTENLIANFKSNKIEGCEPFTVYFTPEITNNVKYSWDFGDGKTSNDKMPKHTYKKAGEYTIKLTVVSKSSNKQVNSLKEKYIKVNSTPIVSFTTSNDGNLYFFDGPDNFENIEWQVNSKTISNENDLEYDFTSIGKNIVTLNVTTKNSCSSSYSKQLSVEPQYSMPNAFTPDNNGNNEQYGPVFEKVDAYKYFLYIYDAYGKLIFKSNYANHNWNGKKLNTNIMSPEGKYLWKLIIKDNYGNKITKKGDVTIRK